MVSSDPAPYLFGQASSEHRRLQRQAEELEPGTRRLLDLVGIPRGARCLDVGSGTGAVMRLLGELVGPEGEVVGLDRDAELGRSALAALRSDGGPRFAHVAGDLEELDGPPGGPFDVVFARLLLFHVDDPHGVLRRLAGWVRPGGALVLQDYDCGAMGCVPPHPAVEAFTRLFFALVEASGRDPRRGAVLPALLVQAGVGEPAGMDGFIQVTPVGPFATQRADALQSVLPVCIERGLVTREEGAALLTQLRELPTDGFRVGYSPLLVGTWWRRPAQS
jgi:SAM-dependent methyltransferase